MTTSNLKFYPKDKVLVETLNIRLDPKDPIHFSNIHSISDHLREEMEIHSGLGMAAPQLGYDVSIFVMNKYTLEYANMPEVFINPKLVPWAPLDENHFHYRCGCLSVPGINPVKCKFYNEFTLEYYDLEARQYRSQSFDEYDDLLVKAVIQHEMDHLKGKLNIHHVKSKSKRDYLIERTQKYHQDKKAKRNG